MDDPRASDSGIAYRQELLVFAVAVALALGFAAWTRNSWEDWFITYRVGKNLALGRGLVYDPGERVHAFTSPLGVLVPAALAYLTGGGSDELVLWLFRAVSGVVLGLTAVLLLRVTRAHGLGPAATLMMLAIVAGQSKAVEFSVNGMETAFLVGFLALGVYALAAATRWPSALLGLGWGGLMWTRPDGFVYIGALAAGFLAFPGALRLAATRRRLLGRFARAGAIAALLYAPWFLWAWSYYGSPIPQPIRAKGLRVDGLAIGARLLVYPLDLLWWDDPTFLPSYGQFGGWPYSMYLLARGLIVPAVAAWLLPAVGPLGRACSLACLIAHAYIRCVVVSVYPWYLPPIGLLAAIVLAQLADQLIAKARSVRGRPGLARAAEAIPVVLAAFAAFQLVEVAHQLRWQQALCEEGNRKQVGLWLRAHASGPRDTVFSECLGYIGFYSGLKMYDYPGLSSPEVVAARRRLGVDDFAALIHALRPDWLVLRPREEQNVRRSAPDLLSRAYRQARVFDVSGEVDRVARDVQGLGYLRGDQTFTVYQRRPEAVGSRARASPTR